ncbi:MAG: PAS domain-containing protein [Longimonas sp.]|uniref:sensor histidine kinase n=1 Tax=Longimonas sp. TaxID=2039626 RepID=UPI003974CB22
MKHPDTPSSASSHRSDHDRGSTSSASSDKALSKTMSSGADYSPRGGADLHELVNRLPGAVYRCTYDTAWTSLYMGQGFKHICDLAPDTLDPAGRSFKDVVLSEDLDRIRCAVRTAIEDRSYYRVEYRIRSNDESIRWVQDNGRPSFADDGSVRWLDGILLDITERKQVQEKLIKAETQVEAKVEARTTKLRKLSTALTMAEQRERSQIASAVHDDLLQYLYGIQVQLRMLLDGLDGTGDLDALLVSPEQVDQLMNEAIDAARKLTLDLAPPVLESDGIIEALQWLRSHLKKRHAFTVELEDQTEGISCAEEVRTVLFRVTRELLLNACKYANVQAARVHVYTHNHTLHLDVVDDGTGFDPSEALQRSTEGSGLWKARECLRSIDGTLQVKAKPGEGTHCTIQLPVDALHPDGSTPPAS